MAATKIPACSAIIPGPALSKFSAESQSHLIRRHPCPGLPNLRSSNPAISVQGRTSSLIMASGRVLLVEFRRLPQPKVSKAFHCDEPDPENRWTGTVGSNFCGTQGDARQGPGLGKGPEAGRSPYSNPGPPAYFLRIRRKGSFETLCSSPSPLSKMERPKRWVPPGTKTTSSP